MNLYSLNAIDVKLNLDSNRFYKVIRSLCTSNGEGSVALFGLFMIDVSKLGVPRADVIPMMTTVVCHGRSGLSHVDSCPLLSFNSFYGSAFLYPPFLPKLYEHPPHPVVRGGLTY
jgi:hypothetical protein